MAALLPGRTRGVVVRIGVLAALVSSLGLPAGTRAGGPWSTARISSTEIGPRTEVALHDGTAHVVAARRDGGILVFRREPRGWVKSVVTTGDDHSPDLGIDAQGWIQIVFVRHGADDRIMHATNRTGAWVVTQVYRGVGRDAYAPQLAVGPGGTHVAFGRDGPELADPPEIAYARREHIGWVTKRVAVVANGVAPSLAVHGGVPRVAYEADAMGRIVIATRSARAWSKETVVVTSGGGPHLAIDGDGVRHLLYQSISSGPRYRWKPASSWLAVPFDAPTDDWAKDLAIGPDSEAVVLLHRASDLQLCRRAGRGAGPFICDDVPQTASAVDPSLVVAANGRARISHAVYVGDPATPCAGGVTCTPWFTRED